MPGEYLLLGMYNAFIFSRPAAYDAFWSVSRYDVRKTLDTRHGWVSGTLRAAW